MSTDIHGGIEFRHPGAGTDYYDGEPWVAAMDLWPLYDETDYAAFGCLFGVRGQAGFRPLAAGRGLPADLSAGVRAQLGTGTESNGLHGASWVNWAELAAIDLTTPSDHFIGRLSWHTRSLPSTMNQQCVSEARLPEFRSASDAPPTDLREATGSVEWTTDELTYRDEPLTVGAVLGHETHWPHVFAVMKELAGRFGDDGVRLVVAFD
ncbi:hypothetical protein [Streptomyces sp. NPDC005244]|uniref:hypothetical protein n=1 Tax=Streptomyces sp. NPDC005244 TaxID=3364708 RepID=UPI003695EBE0